MAVTARRGAAELSAGALRRALRRMRRASPVARPLGETLQDLYVVAFGIVLVAAMVAPLAGDTLRDISARSGSGHAPPGLAAALGIALVLALAGAALRALVLLGPVVRDPADATWLLAAPVDRRGLLLPTAGSGGGRLHRRRCLAGLAAAELGAAPWWGGAAWGALSGLVVCAIAVTGQGRRRTAVLRRLADVVTAVAVAALVLGLTGEAPASSWGHGARSAGVAAALTTGLAVAAGVGSVAMRRAVGRLRRSDLVVGAGLALGLRATVTALDGSFAAETLRLRRVLERGVVRSHRLLGTGPAALVSADVRRTVRWPRGVVVALCAAPLAWAADDLYGRLAAAASIALVSGGRPAPARPDCAPSAARLRWRGRSRSATARCGLPTAWCRPPARSSWPPWRAGWTGSRGGGRPSRPWWRQPAPCALPRVAPLPGGTCRRSRRWAPCRSGPSRRTSSVSTSSCCRRCRGWRAPGSSGRPCSRPWRSRSCCAGTVDQPEAIRPRRTGHRNAATATAHVPCTGARREYCPARRRQRRPAVRPTHQARRPPWTDPSTAIADARGRRRTPTSHGTARARHGAPRRSRRGSDVGVELRQGQARTCGVSRSSSGTSSSGCSSPRSAPPSPTASSPRTPRAALTMRRAMSAAVLAAPQTTGRQRGGADDRHRAVPARHGDGLHGRALAQRRRHGQPAGVGPRRRGPSARSSRGSCSAVTSTPPTRSSRCQRRCSPPVR